MDPNEQNQEGEQPQGEATPNQEQAPAEPVVTEQAAPEEVKEESSVSKNVVIVAVLAVIVLVLAFMYIWGSTTSEPALEIEIPVIPTSEVVEETVPNVSSSDEVEALEADLDASELDTLDAELEQMEEELDAALEEI